MIALHSSDLHGSYKPLLAVDGHFDVWIDTGDFFPNKSKQLGQRIYNFQEMRHQQNWCTYKDLGKRLVDWLDGRPLITVPGNHDFISLGTLVDVAGGRVFDVNPSGFTYEGFCFAGFRNIKYIAGDWPGEMRTPELAKVVEETFASEPDILVTHAPPANILTGYGNYGIGPLYNYLAHRRHHVEQHFFGHEHSDGGKTVERMGIQFHNGATALVFHEID